jgi:UDP-galactopyranose mutase
MRRGDNRSIDLICFSHLRWDWVYQRPQHILGRLARSSLPAALPRRGCDSHGRAPVAPDEPGWTIQEVVPGITRCIPRFRAHWPFFLRDDGPDTRLMRALLGRLVSHFHVSSPVAWVYAPLAVPLLRGTSFAPRAVVYDCMDELALFAGAPPELRVREAELLQLVDCVFAGGRSMFDARRGLHPNLHLFPSSIDMAHFAAATHADTPVPPDARPGCHSPGQPTLGFYGVLDERLDRALLDAVAALRPDWSFVLVGPVAKIDPATLPRRPNIAYPGQRPYEALPGYLKDWDICLMPFALNDATRYISPTKTLEYLAADKPVVSTSIPDVVAGYRDIVRFGDTPEAFVAACEALLSESPEERSGRQARARAILAQTSWEATVGRMAALVDAAIDARQGRSPRGEAVRFPGGGRDEWARRPTGD